MNRLKQLVGEGRAIFASVLCLLSFVLLAPSAQAADEPPAEVAYATAEVFTNGVLSADGTVWSNRAATMKDVTLANGANTLVFDAREAFGEITAKGVKVELTQK